MNEAERIRQREEEVKRLRGRLSELNVPGTVYIRDGAIRAQVTLSATALDQTLDMLARFS